MHTIIYYQSARGEEMVKAFLHGLDKKTQAKAYARLAILEEQGPNLKRPYADIVQDKIRELRIQFSKTNVRILYFFFHKNKIILLHAFKKKDWAVHPQEIETARELKGSGRYLILKGIRAQGVSPPRHTQTAPEAMFTP